MRTVCPLRRPTFGRLVAKGVLARVASSSYSCPSFENTNLPGRKPNCQYEFVLVRVYARPRSRNATIWLGPIHLIFNHLKLLSKLPMFNPKTLLLLKTLAKGSSVLPNKLVPFKNLLSDINI